ncbi:MAG: hypothetical protein ACOCRB_02245, partial [Halanaerobiaceae bacterium]
DGIPPKEGSVLEELQDYYSEIVTEIDQEKRNEKLLEAFKLHVEEGPVSIGTVGGTPRAILVGNNVHNVPEQLDYLGHWYAGYPGSINPEQFYFSEE